MSAPQQIESSLKFKVRSLPIELWPEADRNAWIFACQPSQRLKRGGAGSHMKAITLDDLARRYGYFLDFMNRRGLLDPTKAAGGHVAPENVNAYLEELTARVGSVTVQGSIYKLRRASELIDPARDLSWLADIEKDLALVMRPRSKADRWVLTEVLVEAGLTLIAEAENSRKMSKLGQARQVRNGLMVAMLAMHPIRLKNFAALEIGRNFVEIKGSWWIVLSASETKEDRPDERRIDDLLQPALDRYLKKYRPVAGGSRSIDRGLVAFVERWRADELRRRRARHHRNHPDHRRRRRQPASVSHRDRLQRGHPWRRQSAPRQRAAASHGPSRYRSALQSGIKPQRG